jgi:transcriptional regulator with XRE-family HTH domain
MRIQRLAKGISQGELAHRLGITAQQVQKYERGVNRISCGRLARVAEIVGAARGHVRGRQKRARAPRPVPAAPDRRSAIVPAGAGLRADHAVRQARCHSWPRRVVGASFRQPFIPTHALSEDFSIRPRYFAVL